MQLPAFLQKKLQLNDVEKYNSIREILQNAKETAGDRIAVKCRRRGIVNDVTYNELSDRIDVIGSALLGIPEGCTRAAIIGENSFDYLCTALTLLSSAGTVIPLDKDLPFAEIEKRLALTKCTTVFFDKTYLEQFVKRKSALPGVKNFICFEQDKELPEGILSFSALIDKGERLLAEGFDGFSGLEVPRPRIALMLCKEKKNGTFAVCFTESALCEALYGSLRLNDPGERILSILPFGNSFGLMCGLLGAVYNHSAVCIGEGPRNFIKNLQYYKPDSVAVPAPYVENIWQKIVRNIEKQGRSETMEKIVKTSNAMRKVGIDRRRSFFPSIHEMFGGNLRNVYIDGCLIDEEAVKFFDDVGIRVITGYAVDECASPVAQTPEKPGDFAAAGVLLPCVEVKIDMPDEDGIGEICVRGDVLMNGYFGNEAESRRSSELSGWFHTGDLGRLSDKGQLYVTGNLDGKITLKSGKSFYAEDMEQRLLALPEIREATVYAGKNVKGAEYLVTADISLAPGKTDNKAETVDRIKKAIDALNEGLPSYCRIKSVHIKK